MKIRKHGLSPEEIEAVAAKLQAGEALTEQEAHNTAYSLEFLNREARDMAEKLHAVVSKYDMRARPGGLVDDTVIAYIDAQQAVIAAAQHVNGCIRVESDQVVLLPGLSGALAYLHETLDALKQGK